MKAGNMGNQDYEQAKRQYPARELDEALDIALAKYAAVEPRVGLEERVFATLHAERAKAPMHSWWHWSAVAGLAAVVIVAILLGSRWGKSAHLMTAHNSSAATTMAMANGRGTQVPPSIGNPTRRPLHKPVPSVPGHRSHSLVVAPVPKLDQFPSPQPLSEQEQMLASYVAQFRPQAVLIARVMNEELQRDRMEVMGNSQGSERLEGDDEQQSTNKTK